MGRYQACATCSKYEPYPHRAGCKLYGSAFPAYDVCRWDDSKHKVITYQEEREAWRTSHSSTDHSPGPTA